MIIFYYYSACVGIKTKDISILCDPWFTDGIYDGSWYQFPKVENPIELIGQYDIIYVSHIHPDHYDPIFIRQYLTRYPNTRIIIARGIYLDKKMTVDGIEYELCPKNGMSHGKTSWNIFQNSDDINDIDTALVVKCGKDTVVNMNDNAYSEEQIAEIKAYAPKISIALLGYTGAGEYPQCYYDPDKDHDLMMELAEKKKQDFFDRYRRFDKALNARINIPFAGQYVLGGKLAHLNQYRGVADATEVLAFDPKAIVLNSGGSADTNYSVEDIRTKPYENINEYIEQLKSKEMDYEELNIPLKRIKWQSLLAIAAANAIKRNACEEEYFMIIPYPGGVITINIAQRSWDFSREVPKILSYYPYSIVEADPRHLLGLLLGIYHWNNAEVGSHVKVTRSGIFNRNIQGFLNFFCM